MPLRRLDDEARAVIALANEIAHEYELEYVGTEHILLAILRHGDNIGARVLGRLGVDEERVRASLAEIAQRAKEDTWVFGRLPGSPHYRNVIERAMETAEQLESHSIGTAHLLLALYYDKDSAAQQTLAALGVPLRKCRDLVLRELTAAG
ncbi:MAG: Clp protease N-terminal domain-containing protein [Planctomycetota bacterium]